MKKKLFILFCLFYYLSIVKAQTEIYSQLIYPGADGKLVYRPYTDRGDILPDFSWCGYMGGGVELPDIPVVAMIEWANRPDDTPVIQAVIDSLASLPLNKNGFRGAILLKKGTYRIASTIRITTSGIVLRGEMNDKFNGTVLLATSQNKYNVIEVGANGRLNPVPGSEHPITDDYVPSGTRIVHVSNATLHFKVGDQVAIRRPSTAEWIRAIGMDSIPPRPLAGETTEDSFRRLRESKGNTNMNGTSQWAPGTKNLIFERTVTAVKGDMIEIDIPLTNALQSEYGGGTIFKYEFPERITQCGVEHLYGSSVFDAAVKQEDPHLGWYYSDENHANNFISIRAAENCWVRNVTVEYIDRCVETAISTKFFTGQNLSAIHPVSLNTGHPVSLTGSRRFGYSISGQMILFEHCYANYHRHTYVLGSTVAGPNAFVNGHSDMNLAPSEPHHRWSTGCLFDNITIKGPVGSLVAVNCGWYGTGHGWSGAQMVFWNCSAPLILVMKPPTAQNFAIGNNGKITEQHAANARLYTIGAVNEVSRSNFVDNGDTTIGNGYIEHQDTPVWPQSLYYAQLKDRKNNQQ